MPKSWILFLILSSVMLPLASQQKVNNTVVASVQQKESVVYITKTGEKYHKENCRHLSKSSIKVSRKDAIKNGYAACKVCKP